jgi:tetratricopeptide (TPR) repeat protein
MHHHGGGHQHAHPGLAAVGGGYAAYGFWWPYYVGGPGYYSPYFPVMATMGPAAFFTPFGGGPPPMPVRGPLLPPPPRQPVARGAQAAKPAAADPNRSGQLLTFGDRLLRAGNIKKAEERYLQASAASPNQAAPYVRLAQIAIARGHYTEAAARLRDAETAEPGWVLTAPDIQSIYGEPTAFLAQLARLESHVQSHPDDRDAWLVLGAQWFLSGRTARAADVFTRLNDPNRKADVALSAFLFASNQRRPRAGEGDDPAPMTGRAEPAHAAPDPSGK